MTEYHRNRLEPQRRTGSGPRLEGAVDVRPAPPGIGLREQFADCGQESLQNSIGKAPDLMQISAQSHIAAEMEKREPRPESLSGKDLRLGRVTCRSPGAATPPGALRLDEGVER